MSLQGEMGVAVTAAQAEFQVARERGRAAERYKRCSVFSGTRERDVGGWWSQFDWRSRGFI